MKKFLLLACLAIIVSAIAPSLFRTNEAKSQIVTTLTPIAANDTLTNTDTAWIYVTTSTTHAATFSSTNSVADNISRAITIRVIKVSGTVAGSVTFEGSNDATNWETISSAFTLTDVANQVKTFDIRSAGGDMLFKYYRAVFISSGTNMQIPKLYYLRRSN